MNEEQWLFDDFQESVYIAGNSSKSRKNKEREGMQNIFFLHIFFSQNLINLDDPWTSWVPMVMTVLNDIDASV